MMGGAHVDHSCRLLTLPFPEQINKTFLVNTQVTERAFGSNNVAKNKRNSASLSGPKEFTEER